MMEADAAVLVVQIAELEALDRDALVLRWEKVFGNPAPRRSRPHLLRAALAWQVQMDAASGGRAGGLRAAQRLTKAMTSTAPSSASQRPKAGTRLVREWRGEAHHVTVTEGGFEYSGQTYRSLTAIARRITGSPWSGPRFFGLRT